MTLTDQLKTLVTALEHQGILFEDVLDEVRAAYIERVLRRVNGNQSRAAKQLGIHRNTLATYVTKYRILPKGVRK